MTTTSDLDAQKDAAMRQWWKDWWAQDFSWDGLGEFTNGWPKHPWRGWSVIGEDTGQPTIIETDKVAQGTLARKATLRDYFRWDFETYRDDDTLRKLGLLVKAPNGQTFHILHAPVKDDQGEDLFDTLDEAKDWNRVERELFRLINDSTEIKTESESDWLLIGADTRSQISGAVIRKFPYLSKKNKTLNLNSCYSIWLQKLILKDFRFGNYTNFNDTIFLEGAIFEGSNYNGKTFITRSTFFGETTFSCSNFLHNTYFNFSRFFNNADFEQAHFQGNISFHSTIFYEESYFNSIDCSANTDFTEAQFHNTTLITEAKFKHTSDFDDTSFHKKASFSETVFFNNTSIRKSIFYSKSDFSEVVFSSQVETHQNMFEGTRFQDQAFFKSIDKLPCSIFNSAIFEKGLILDPKHPDPKQFTQIIEDTKAAVDQDIADHDPEEQGELTQAQRADYAEQRFAALEGGCRVLKQAMAEAHDRLREQRFYRMELIARAHRPSTRGWAKFCSKIYEWSADYGSDPARALGRILIFGLGFFVLYLIAGGFAAPHGPPIGPPKGVHFFTYLITGVSVLGISYGTYRLSLPKLNAPKARWQSLLIPTGLILLICILAGLVIQHFGPAQPLHPTVGDSLVLAVKNMFGPFRLVFGNTALFDHIDKAPIFHLVVHVLSTIQTIASTVLIFLGLLSLRRYFQIN